MANSFSLAQYYDLIEKDYDTEEIIEFFTSQSVHVE